MKKTPHRDLNPGCLAPQGAMLFGLLVLRWGFWEKLEKREKRLSKRATGSPARRAYRQAHSAFTELEYN